MYSNDFLRRHVPPTIDEIYPVNQNDAVATGLKNAAEKEINYFCILENDLPMGIVPLRAVLLNIDQLADLSWSQLVDPSFCFMAEDELDQLESLSPSERFILVQKNSAIVGVVDLTCTSAHQEKLMNKMTESIHQELASVKKNEALLESVIANSYDGIYLTDRNGLTLTVNRSYERITGIKKELLLGKYMKNLVEQGLLSVYITDDVVMQKQPVTHTQTIRNGKKVVITGSPIFDENGEVVMVITNVRDITELINLEKKLLISHEMTSLYEKELFKDLAKDNIVCQSPKFTETIHLAKRVSPKDSTVLILGETGAGKEIVARYIHLSSKRKNQHYVKINCGSIPAQLLESELFGYMPGAFTGASPKGKMGMFELANEGTLFLDEIGEMPIDLQSSLLRVLQDGEIIRVGDIQSRKVDVRIIAATNRNLEEMIVKGTFRRDLFYRLNVVSIYVPPLRERLEDIPALAEHFISKLNEKYGEGKVITSNFIDQLMQMDWPGNIREMSNFIEKQYIITDEEILDTVIHYQTGAPQEESSLLGITVNGIIPLNEAVKEVESILVGRAMQKCKTTYKAAELLKISQPTFFRKYKEFYGEGSQQGDS